MTCEDDFKKNFIELPYQHLIVYTFACQAENKIRSVY